MSTTSSLFNNNNLKHSSFNHRKAHLCRSPLRILRVSDAAWFTSLGNPAVCDYTSREQRSAFIPTLTFILQRHNNTTKVCPNSTNEMKDFAKKKKKKKYCVKAVSGATSGRPRSCVKLRLLSIVKVMNEIRIILLILPAVLRDQQVSTMLILWLLVCCSTNKSIMIFTFFQT